MSLKKIIGITKDTSKSILQPDTPNNCYFVIRNRSYDDTVRILQEVEKTEAVDIMGSDGNILNKTTQTIKTLINTQLKKTDEVSFLIKNNKLRFEIHTDIDYTIKNEDIPLEYRGLTLIINKKDSDSESSINVYTVDILNATDWYQTVSLQTKGKTYTVPQTDKTLDVETVENQTFPKIQSYTEKDLLASAYYNTYLAAGRGFYLKSVTGLLTYSKSEEAKTTDIYRQTQKIQHKVGVDDASSTDFNIQVNLSRIPYNSKAGRTNLKTTVAEFEKYYGDTSNPNENIDAAYKPDIGNAFLIIEPSIYSSATGNTKLNTLNFTGYSGLASLVYDKTSSASMKSNAVGFTGTIPNHKESQNYILNADSLYQFPQSNFDKEKVQGFSIDIKPTSKNFPYSISFTGSSMTGITFESETEVSVVLRDRKTKYNLPESVRGKLSNYIVNYEDTYAQLYIDGVAQDVQEQLSIPVKNFEITSLGLDVKQSTTLNTISDATLTLPYLGSTETLQVTSTENEENINEYAINLGRKQDYQSPTVILPYLEKYQTQTNRSYVPFGYSEGYMIPQTKNIDNSKTYDATTNPSFIQIMSYDDQINPTSSYTINSLSSTDPDKSEFSLENISFSRKKDNQTSAWASGIVQAGIKGSITGAATKGWFEAGQVTKNIETDSDGFTLSDKINLQNIPIFTADNKIDISTLNFEAQYKPAFVGEKDRNTTDPLQPYIKLHKATIESAYKLLSATQESSLVTDASFGTDTMSVRLFMILDNTAGIYNDQTWTQLTQGMLSNAVINFVYANKSDTDTKFRPSGKAGYRGLGANSKFPQSSLGTPASKTVDVTYANLTNNQKLTLDANYGSTITLTPAANTIITGTSATLGSVDDTGLIITVPLATESNSTQSVITFTVSETNKAEKAITLTVSLTGAARVTKEYDKTIGYIDMAFSTLLDSTLENIKEFEGEVIISYKDDGQGTKSVETKPYIATLIPFASMVESEDTLQHENAYTSGLGYKGCLVIMQVADTEADKNDYIGIRVRKSTEVNSFQTEQAKQGNLLETGVGLALTTQLYPVQALKKGETDALDGLSTTSSVQEINLALSKLNPLYLSGIQNIITQLYDITFGNHPTLPQEISCLTKHIEYDVFNSVQDKDKIDFSNYQIPRISYTPTGGSATQFPKLGDPYLCIVNPSEAQIPNVKTYTIADIVVSNDISAEWKNVGFFSKENAIKFAELINTTYKNAQADPTTASGLITDDQIAKITSGWDSYFKNMRQYVPYASFNDLSFAIDNLNTLYTNNKSTVVGAFQQIIEDAFLTTRQSIQLAYIRFGTCRFSPNPISLGGISDEQKLFNPAIFIWNTEFNKETVTLPRKEWQTIELQNYSKPTDTGTDITAEIGQLVLFSKSLTTDQITQAYNHARIWRDFDSTNILPNDSQVSDLYDLIEIEKEIYPSTAPVLNENLSEFAKNLAYGRVKDKEIPQGGRFFINLWDKAWTVSNSTIKSVGYRVPEETLKYYFTEEVYNPDLECTTVWFIPKEGVIPLDYWWKNKEDSNSKYMSYNSWHGYSRASHYKSDNTLICNTTDPIPLHIYITATSESGEVGEVKLPFSITKPVILSLNTIEQTKNNLTETFPGTSYAGYQTDGSYMFSRGINKNVYELFDMNLLTRENGNLHIAGYYAGLTPSRFCYSTDFKKVYRVPRLLWIGNKILTHKTQELIADSEGNTHIIPSPTPILSSEFVGTGKDYNNLALFLHKTNGTVAGSDGMETMQNNLATGVAFDATFGGGSPVWYYMLSGVSAFRLCFKITANLSEAKDKGTYYLPLGSCSIAGISNLYTWYVPNARLYVSNGKTILVVRFYGVEKEIEVNIVENRWYYLDLAFHQRNTTKLTITSANPMSLSGDIYGLFQVWLLDTGESEYHKFDKQKVLDRTNWQELVSYRKNADIGVIKSSNSDSNVTKWRCGSWWLHTNHNCSTEMIVNVDECVFRHHYRGSNYANDMSTDAQVLQMFNECFGKTIHDYDTFGWHPDQLETDDTSLRGTDYRARQENPFGFRSVFESTPNYGLAGNDRYNEFKYRSTSSMHSNIGFISNYHLHPGVTSGDASVKYFNNYGYTTSDYLSQPGCHSVGVHKQNDYNWYTVPIHGLRNPQFDNMCDGYIEAPAMVLDQVNQEWLANKSNFTQWLDNELGLPYAHDYRRQVRVKRLWNNEITNSDNPNCFAYKDSINYEFQRQSSSALGKLVSPNGKIWDASEDYLYEMYQYFPRFHYVCYSYIMRIYGDNKSYLHRQEYLSMAEFKVCAGDMSGENYDALPIVGNTTGYSIDGTYHIKVNEFSASNFFNSPSNMESINIGSGRVVTETIKGNKIVYIYSRPHYSFIGHLDNLDSKSEDGKTQYPITPLLGHWISTAPVQDMPSANATDSVSANWQEPTVSNFGNGIGTFEQAVIDENGKDPTNASSQVIEFKTFAGYGSPSKYYSGRSPATLATRRMQRYPGYFLMRSISHIRENTANKGTIWEYLTPYQDQLWDAECVIRQLEAGGPAAMNRGVSHWCMSWLNAPGADNSNKRIMTTTKPFCVSPFTTYCSSGHVYSRHYWLDTIEQSAQQYTLASGNRKGQKANFCSGSGAVEANIKYALQENKCNFYSTHTAFPRIDYSYFNPTKDSAVTSSAILTPANYSDQSSRTTGLPKTRPESQAIVYYWGCMPTSIMYRGKELSDTYRAGKQLTYGAPVQMGSQTMFNKFYVPIGHPAHFQIKSDMSCGLTDYLQTRMVTATANSSSAYWGACALTPFQPGTNIPAISWNGDCDRWGTYQQYRNVAQNGFIQTAYWNTPFNYGYTSIASHHFLEVNQCCFQLDYTMGTMYHPLEHFGQNFRTAIPHCFYLSVPTTSASFAMKPPSDAQKYLYFNGELKGTDDKVKRNDSSRTWDVTDVSPGYKCMKIIMENDATVNNSTAITYELDAKGLTMAQKMAWLGNYPCLLLAGGTEGDKLNPDNYAQTISGTSANITGANETDVMIKFPRRGFCFKTVGNQIHIYMTDEPNHPAYCYAPFQDGTRELSHFYVGAYMAYAANSKLYSRSGVYPANTLTIGQFRTYAKNRGKGYTIWTHYMWTYVQVCYCLIAGNKNSQNLFGAGVSSGSNGINTGGANSYGMNSEKHAGKTNTRLSSKCLGIEDLWGNLWQWVDGIVSKNYYVYMSNDISNFNDAGNGYKNIGLGINGTVSGNYFSKVFGTNEGGFIPTKANGSSATVGWTDGYWNNGGDRIYKVGGCWYYGSLVGVFSCTLFHAASNADANHSSRLCHYPQVVS